MPQVIGNPPNTTGLQLAVGPNNVGQVLILTGAGDPNDIDDSAVLDRPGVKSAAIGSLFLRQDGSTSTTLYVKTALPNVWTGK